MRHSGKLSEVRFFVFLPLLFVSTLLLFRCFIIFARADEAKPLVIGMELNYPPFEMVTPEGEPSGVGVDLAHALAVSLKRPLQIVNTPFEGLIPALKTGRIDLIISSMTATDERRKSIDFSDPYVTTGLAILVPKTSLVQKIADLNQPGVNVVVKAGTTSETYARENLPRAQVLSFSQDSACALEVIQGKAQAFIYDQMSVYQYSQKNPRTTRGLLQPFHQESWAIGIRKGNAALAAEVNQFLRQFRAAKGFDALGDKYLRADKEAFRQMGFPFYL